MGRVTLAVWEQNLIWQEPINSKAIGEAEAEFLLLGKSNYLLLHFLIPKHVPTVGDWNCLGICEEGHS